MARPIVFLSDLGMRDESVGACRLVIERIAPGSTVIDLSHGVPPQDVSIGANLLADGVPFLPPDAVVLAVVDPGSGTERRAVAIETGSGIVLVGPDNGLLSLAWPALGDVRHAVEITSPDVILQTPTRVLDARDVFAPAAAWLARGGSLDDLGPSVDPASLETRRLVEPDVESHVVKGEVLEIDRFGNIRLNMRPNDLERAGPADAGLQVTTPNARPRFGGSPRTTRSPRRSSESSWTRGGGCRSCATKRARPTRWVSSVAISPGSAGVRRRPDRAEARRTRRGLRCSAA